MSTFSNMSTAKEIGPIFDRGNRLVDNTNHRAEVRSSLNNTQRQAEGQSSVNWDNLKNSLDLLGNALRHLPLKHHYYSERSVMNYLEHPIEIQRAVRERLTSYSHLINEIVRERADITNNTFVLKRWLQNLKLSTLNEIYERIEDDNIVEVYNAQGVQVFRSIQFFYFCNYDLLDVETRAWNELYERHELINNRLFEIVYDLFASPNKVFNIDVPPHPMREVFSDFRQVFRIEHNCMAPVYNSDCSLFGFVSSQKATTITQNDPEDSFLFLKR